MEFPLTERYSQSKKIENDVHSKGTKNQNGVHPG